MLTDSVIHLILLVHIYTVSVPLNWLNCSRLSHLGAISALGFSSFFLSWLCSIDTVHTVSTAVVQLLTFQWQQQTDLELLIQTNETYKDEPLNGHVASVAKGLVR